MGDLKSFLLEVLLPILLIYGLLLGGVGAAVTTAQWYSCTHSPLDTTYQGFLCYVRDPLTGEVIPFDKYRSVDGSLRVKE